MPAKRSLSLVVPVYNEEGNLEELFKEIRETLNKGAYDWEVVFVDDGSFDASLDLLKKMSAKDSRVRFLSFAANCGQSAAFAAGFGYAAKELIVTLDADLQNDPGDIPKMVELLEDGYDMVIGWRAKRRDSWVKRAASRFANSVRNSVSREAVKDTGCSLKIMRADMARRIPMFTGMHRFLPTLMKLEGARVAEIEVNHRPRRHGHSKYGIWDRAFAALWDLLAVRWMQSRHISYTIKEKK